jgi:hypothetical protein
MNHREASKVQPPLELPDRQRKSPNTSPNPTDMPFKS